MLDGAGVLGRMRGVAVGAAMLGACGRFGALPPLQTDSGGSADANGSADGNGSGDGGGSDVNLTITASTSSYTIHVGDLRTPTFIITNNSGIASGVPQLGVTGLTLGTLTFTTNTCTAGLQPGQSCKAVGNLAATTAGQQNFQVTADLGSTQMSLTTLDACPTTCGANGTSDCCASSVVPGNAVGATLAGASFFRSFDVATDNMFSNMGFPATVSDIRFDTYLVTVGRFRQFVTAGMGTLSTAPAGGSGAHPNIPGSGWDAGDNNSTNFPSDTNGLVSFIENCSSATYTTSPGTNENLPLDCGATWFMAFAFCIWDGGFLPTEAEWNYAAAGGSEQRAYPWSSPAGDLTIDCAHANYFVNVPSGNHCVNGSTGFPNNVGSESPTGDGKFGQSDLGGNLTEWVLDWSASPYPTATCDNCANLTPASNRVLRGGGSLDGATGLRTANRGSLAPFLRGNNVGFRCARLP